jgi:hypothetical protein
VSTLPIQQLRRLRNIYLRSGVKNLVIAGKGWDQGGGMQLGFADFEQSMANRCTKRERFLAEMEVVVLWKCSSF